MKRTNRLAPLAMGSDEFRETGYQLVDRIADFLDSIAARPVNPAESPVAVREALGGERRLPQEGETAGGLLQRTAEVYLSNAGIDGKFALRACIVNFRTSSDDIEALPSLVVRSGKELDSQLRALPSI
ncbi:hypothetical protein [Nevskia soli]|uniref:hypothetical protein n=1 Tax=Nevskia soli TaxID=418856 RepID=UPI0015D71900|nr:hypothetical protein [Nevskia soli]